MSCRLSSKRPEVTKNFLAKFPASRELGAAYTALPDLRIERLVHRYEERAEHLHTHTHYSKAMNSATERPACAIIACKVPRFKSVP
jgi:hypothetical protein